MDPCTLKITQLKNILRKNCSLLREKLSSFWMQLKNWQKHRGSRRQLDRAN